MSFKDKFCFTWNITSWLQTEHMRFSWFKMEGLRRTLSGPTVYVIKILSITKTKRYCLVKTKIKVFKTVTQCYCEKFDIWHFLILWWMVFWEIMYLSKRLFLISVSVSKIPFIVHGSHGYILKAMFINMFFLPCNDNLSIRHNQCSEISLLLRYSHPKAHNLTIIPKDSFTF